MVLNVYPINAIGLLSFKWTLLVLQVLKMNILSLVVLHCLHDFFLMMWQLFNEKKLFLTLLFKIILPKPVVKICWVKSLWTRNQMMGRLFLLEASRASFTRNERNLVKLETWQPLESLGLWAFDLNKEMGNCPRLCSWIWLGNKDA